MQEEPKVSVGRPRKRDQAVIQVAEAMGMRLSADVMSLEELEGFPNLANESEKNKGIMCMWACGIPQSHIAEAFNIRQPTVWGIINRIDPSGAFKLSPNAKKALITKMVQGVAMSAVGSISMADLMELDADKRANVASKMVKIAQDLNTSKHREINSTKMSLMMQQMEDLAEVSEGEFTQSEFSTDEA